MLELRHGLVGDQHGALGGRHLQNLLAQFGGHRFSGRVVEVRHQIAERGRGSLQDLLEHRGIPALPDRDGGCDESTSGAAQRIVGVRITGRLHQDAIAPVQQGARDQCDRVLRSDGDHDLLERGRQTARSVAIGDRLPQHGKANRVEPRVAEVGAEFGGGLSGDLDQSGEGGHRRLAEVRHVRHGRCRSVRPRRRAAWQCCRSRAHCRGVRSASAGCRRRSPSYG